MIIKSLAQAQEHTRRLEELNVAGMTTTEEYARMSATTILLDPCVVEMETNSTWVWMFLYCTLGTRRAEFESLVDTYCARLVMVRLPSTMTDDSYDRIRVMVDPRARLARDFGVFTTGYVDGFLVKNNPANNWWLCSAAKG